jgi:hypothetical protein
MSIPHYRSRSRRKSSRSGPRSRSHKSGNSRYNVKQQQSATDKEFLKKLEATATLRLNIIKEYSESVTTPGMAHAKILMKKSQEAFRKGDLVRGAAYATMAMTIFPGVYTSSPMTKSQFITDDVMVSGLPGGPGTEKDLLTWHVHENIRMPMPGRKDVRKLKNPKTKTKTKPIPKTNTKRKKRSNKYGLKRKTLKRKTLRRPQTRN